GRGDLDDASPRAARDTLGALDAETRASEAQGLALDDPVGRLLVEAVAEDATSLRSPKLREDARVVGVGNRDPALVERLEERALLEGHVVDGTQARGMGRRDQGQDAGVGGGDFGEARDLSGAARAQLHDG